MTCEVKASNTHWSKIQISFPKAHLPNLFTSYEKKFYQSPINQNLSAVNILSLRERNLDQILTTYKRGSLTTAAPCALFVHLIRENKG